MTGTRFFVHVVLDITQVLILANLSFIRLLIFQTDHTVKHFLRNIPTTLN
jgi:hypothetical protein